MNNRVLGIFAGLVSLALVAVLVLFFTTSQNLSDTEDDLSNARQTGTAQLDLSVAQAEAAASTATTSFEEGVQALQDSEDAAATQQAQAEATQTKAAENLADSEATATTSFERGMQTQQAAQEAAMTQEALALAAQEAAETAQSELAATATTSFEEGVQALQDAEDAAATQQAQAEASQAALEEELQANQTEAANISLTATAAASQQAETIASLENDLSSARADLQTAQDTQFALSSELANASIELQSVAATATASANEVAALRSTVESLSGQLLATAEPTEEIVIEATPVPTSAIAQPSTSKLLNFNQGWQAATDELISLGLIPTGGQFLWELTSTEPPIETFGVGGNNLILDQEDTSHTNVVIASNITTNFSGTFAETGELELCRLAARLVIRNESIAESVSAILANDGYFFALDDFGDTDAEFITFGDRDLGIASGQTYHLLMIVDGTEMTVYIDGRLVMERAQVDEHFGDFAAVGSLGVSDETRCTFENTWVYRLP